MRNPFAVALLTLLGAAVGAACTVDDPLRNPPATAAFQSKTGSASIGAKGGKLDLTASDGTTYTLDVPPGALRKDTTLSLTTAEPVDGDRFHVVVGPPGLLLEPETAAKLNVRLPAGHELSDKGGLAVDGAPAPFTREADRSVSLEVRSTSSVAPKARGPRYRVSVATCGMPTASPQGITGADTVDLAIYAQCMAVAIDHLSATGQFEDAVRASLAVAAVLQQVGGNGAGDAQQYIDQAKSNACLGRGAAFSLAESTTVLSLGDYHAFLRPMAYWEVIVQKLGANCAGQATFADAASALTDKAIALYDANRPMIQDPAGARYRTTLTEASDSRAARSEVSALEPPAPVTATVNAQLKDRAEKTLLSELLDGPWTSCRNGGDYEPIMAVMDALASPDEAKTVAQYCSVAIQAEAWSAGPMATSLGTAGPLGDVSRTERATMATVNAAADGSLKLAGLARSMACPATTQGTEALVFAIHGVEVKRVPGPNYLANSIDLDVHQALITAGIDPMNPGQSQTLTIARDGDACGGYWGMNPSPLISLTLGFHRTKIAVLDGVFGSNGIIVANDDGSGATTLPVPTAFLHSASISPDGRRVAFSSLNAMPPYPGPLKVAPVDGSAITTITGGANQDVFPSWSPDGKRLVFGSAVFGMPNLFYLKVVNDDGSAATELVSGDASTIPESPSWSPDGKRIAFLSLAIGSATPYTVTLINADGSGRVALPNASALNLYSAVPPVWSPDSKQLLISTQPKSIVNADGTGAAMPLSWANPYATSLFAWSPDGKRLAFTDGVTLRSANLDGSDAHEILKCPNGCFSPSYSR